MSDARRDAIRRARAMTYQRQQDLRRMLHETVDEDLRMDVRAALSAWLAKEAEVDAFVRWLASQAVPQECAGILSWLLSSPEVAFAAYNVYLRKQARVAAAQAAGLNAQVRNIAGDLAAQIKPEK